MRIEEKIQKREGAGDRPQANAMGANAYSGSTWMATAVSNPVQVQLGDSLTGTLKPKATNPGAPEVTIKVTYDMTEVT